MATMAGLSVGALAVYTPEEGININMLQKDISHLRESFASDQGMNRAGKLILRFVHLSANRKIYEMLTLRAGMKGLQRPTRPKSSPI